MPTTKNRKVSKKKPVRKKAEQKTVRNHMRLLESWAEFVTIPITKLTQTQLLEMLEHEKAHAQRWSFINRLHGAYNAKRVKQERDELRRKYQ